MYNERFLQDEISYYILKQKRNSIHLFQHIQYHILPVWQYISKRQTQAVGYLNVKGYSESSSLEYLGGSQIWKCVKVKTILV